MEWSSILTAVLMLIGATLLVSAGIEDAHHRTIANGKNAALALLAPVWWWANGLAVWPDMAIQLGIAAAIFLPFVGAFAMGWMGGGDVKLIGALGLWLPLGAFVEMLVVMSILGGVLTIIMLVEARWRRTGQIPEIPYGIAIATAALLVAPGTVS